MAKPTIAKGDIEAQRLALLHQEQSKMRKRLKKEIKVKKAGPHLPGQEQLLRHTAVLLKIGVPGISYLDIANRLGETKSTVKQWFNEPDVKEFYQFVVNNLKEGSLELLKTYSLEAVETLVILMRFGSEKYMFESAREILDRIGVAKVSRQEGEYEYTQKHKWGDRDKLVEEIRQLPPEQQEEVIEAMEKFEDLLASNVTSNGDTDKGELKTIRNVDEDEELDDDEGDE